MHGYYNILILNGPNLNLLGQREPEIYGNQSFESYFISLKNRFSDINLAYEQTNSEGKIIDLLQEYGLNQWGIILNAAGYSHTSIAIADTVKAIPEKVVEIHISNIFAREAFRHHSFLTEVCDHHIIGKGIEGYAEAIEWLK